MKKQGRKPNLKQKALSDLKIVMRRCVYLNASPVEIVDTINDICPKLIKGEGVLGLNKTDLASIDMFGPDWGDML